MLSLTACPSGLEIESQIFTDLVMVNELTSDTVVPDILDHYFLGQFSLFFIIDSEVKECFLANGYVVHAGNRESNATTGNVVNLHLASACGGRANE